MATAWVIGRHNTDNRDYFGGRLLGYSVVRRVRVPFRCRALVHQSLRQGVAPDPLSPWVDAILETLKAMAAADVRKGHIRHSMKAAGGRGPRR